MLPSILIFALVTCSVGSLLVAVLYRSVNRGSVLDRRIELLSRPSSVGRTAAARGGARKQSVEKTLLEAEEKQKANAKKRPRPTLLTRMRQADLHWSKGTYAVLSVAAGVVSFAGAYSIAGLGVVAGGSLGIAAGFLLPHLYVGFRRARRLKRFAEEFPNAIDVIVRGVKAGLPLSDCFKIIAAEAQEPVRSEFKVLAEDQTMGLPMEEAVERLPQRVPLAEAEFFAIVIAMQSRTGGSLSEALGNLSKVLRERKKMKAKIKAVSSEAKSSAGIIGSLPVAVGALVYVISPQYMALLFATTTGNLVLVGCLIWMLIGVAVMRQMINFEI